MLEKIETETIKKFIPEVEDLRRPTEKILSEIYPEIERGAYQAIIGDDASGRIPALLFRKIINSLYTERGFPTLETRFVAGSRNYQMTDEEIERKQSLLSEFIHGLRNDLEKKHNKPIQKVLIVTEYVETGKALDPLIQTLKEYQIDFDVVTIDVSDSMTEEAPKRWGKDIIFGRNSDSLPKIYGESRLNGVEKNARELFSTPAREKSPCENGEASEMAIAREDANLLAKEILEKLKKDST